MEKSTGNLKTLDLTLPTPAENLACDEALLELCEQTKLPGVLRFWESPDYFVVVGYANRVAMEVNVAACQRRRVPILRRCSGGGTVVQGPGCLNYALVMPPPAESVTETNRFIMERHREALARVLSGSRVSRDFSGVGVPPARRPRTDTRDAYPTVTFDGHTDLALDGKKFSGNSQRRRKHCILFHGTFLLGFDLALVEELLRMPSKQPAYRQRRAHTEFLINLDVPAASIKAALREAWGATPQLATVPTARIAELVAEKYATRAWNNKF